MVTTDTLLANANASGRGGQDQCQFAQTHEAIAYADLN